MRVQVRVQKKYFFEFKFGKMIEFFRVQVRVRSPGFYGNVCEMLANILAIIFLLKLGHLLFLTCKPKQQQCLKI